MNPFKSHFEGGSALDIIAFRVNEQEYCVETRLVREIRGWSPCTPVPHSPPSVIGVISLRGTVIPIIDLADRLGMDRQEGHERSAIVVVEAGESVVGLVVDRVSDILTLGRDRVQDMPSGPTAPHLRFAEGMITIDTGLMCLLNIERVVDVKNTLPERSEARAAHTHAYH